MKTGESSGTHARTHPLRIPPAQLSSILEVPNPRLHFNAEEENLIQCLRCGLVGSLALCLVAWTADARAATIDIPVSATSTFLLTNSDNTASDSTPIDLTALGILPGATIDLLRLGDFLYCSDCQPVGLDMIGVFSSTPTLLASNELNRVPGAIDMGGFGAVNTVPTYFGSIPTNISQDFLISGDNDGVTVVVPAGAQFLFVAVPDSFIGDNLDENQDYGLRLSYSSPVPEPASMTLTALGLFGLLARRWARSA